MVDDVEMIAIFFCEKCDSMTATHDFIFEGAKILEGRNTVREEIVTVLITKTTT